MISNLQTDLFGGGDIDKKIQKQVKFKIIVIIIKIEIVRINFHIVYSRTSKVSYRRAASICSEWNRPQINIGKICFDNFSGKQRNKPKAFFNQKNDVF